MRFHWEKELLEAIKKAPRENLLGGWLVVLLGLFILGISAFDTVPKLRTYRWVSGIAQVTATDVYERTGRNHGWCGRVSYTYVVDGRTYKSRNLTSAIISDEGCHRDKAQVTAGLAKFAPGADIRIFYDPAAPARVAIVREELKWHDGFFALLAVLTLALGGSCIVQARRVLRRRT
ncbi:Protein of unknown function [Duganella sp. CF402]|uniref:DUF3592 domain-containing protein n=1 Tax=unclassified Duganella TaxID=2636909 RepID=UPI0008C1B6BB|nr:MULTISPECIES: DUF3592 domain-containing protein [unclassified Duganella]RZT10121.1 uncharacterized protein DUF3592 [Duganella sp. BK701]SEL27478.1 Protein of unknown function [Duganella sp. CF402]